MSKRRSWLTAFTSYARPGVLRRVEVLPRPRTPDTYTDPALTRLRHEVLDLLLEARNPSVLSDAIYPY